MRKRLKPLVVLIFFVGFISSLLISRQFIPKVRQQEKRTEVETLPSSSPETNPADLTKPIIDLSGWQLPSEINYDQLSQNISGAIIRIQSGSYTKKENTATYANGLDKSYKTHIQEFQKRNVPVAVYAYVAAANIKEMEKEAESFYKAASKYNPTYYWLDVEEKTMPDMNAGVEAFRAKLESLGAKKIGLYIGTYFMEEHSISTEKFSAIWIPTYGSDNGYYNAAPQTDINYDLHQYTSQGSISGFPHIVDLNQLSPLKDRSETFAKLFGQEESKNDKKTQ
ncbi:glycoside hydrolase family 25 protein [Streptococcus oricebi]|uniref:Glycosyl hydrolase family 25 n=1 Tax=Streptococcus oricebi TaxID=1547447 RepID=A0ABS5B157_9STRE|nr:glycoside hydrolase family 25 protein [Streptococcus oricebi]MBP2622552.1 glycosyl hydrolase family 25 [Streptococcus oricebi]